MMDEGGQPGGGGGPDPQQALAMQDPQRQPLMPLPNDAVNQDDLRMLGLLEHEMEVHELLRDMPQILPPGGDFLIPPEEVIMPQLEELPLPQEQRQAPPEGQPAPPRHRLEQEQSQNQSAREVAARSQEVNEEDEVPSASQPQQSGPSASAPYASNRNGHRSALLASAGADTSSLLNQSAQPSQTVATRSRETEIAPDEFPLHSSPSPSINATGVDGAVGVARSGGSGTRRRGFAFFGKRRQA